MDVLASDQARAKALDLGLLRRGSYALSNVRRLVSAAHTDEDFALASDALDNACRVVT